MTILLFTSLDVVFGIWPVDAGAARWRFGAASFVSGSLITPFLAILLVYAVAARSGHTWIQGAVSLLTAIAALLLMGGVAIVLLDGMAIREQVQPDAVNTVQVAMARAGLKLGAGSAVYLVIAVAAFRTFARERRRRKARLAVDKSTLMTG